MPHIPNWLTWILHGLIHAGVGVMFWSSGFTLKQTASLMTAGLVWWTDREESQDGFRKPDDYLDLVGPTIATGVFWVLAFVFE